MKKICFVRSIISYLFLNKQIEFCEIKTIIETKNYPNSTKIEWISQKGSRSMQNIIKLIYLFVMRDIIIT